MSGKLGVNPHVALRAFIHRPLFNLHQKVSVGHICSLGLTQDTRWALQGLSMLAAYRPPRPAAPKGSPDPPGGLRVTKLQGSTWSAPQTLRKSCRVLSMR